MLKEIFTFSRFIISISFALLISFTITKEVNLKIFTSNSIGIFLISLGFQYIFLNWVIKEIIKNNKHRKIFFTVVGIFSLLAIFVHIGYIDQLIHNISKENYPLISNAVVYYMIFSGFFLANYCTRNSWKKYL